MAGGTVGGSVAGGCGVAVGARRVGVGVVTGGETGVRVGFGGGMGVRVGGGRVGGGLVGGGRVGGGLVGGGGVGGSGVGTAVGCSVGATTMVGRIVGKMTGVSVVLGVLLPTPIGTRVAIFPVGVAVVRNWAIRPQIPSNQLVLATTVPQANTRPVIAQSHHTRNDLRGAVLAVFGAGEAGTTLAGAATAAGKVAIGGFLAARLPLVSAFTGWVAGWGDGLTSGATGAAAAPITAGFGRACSGSTSGAISMGRMGANE